MAMYRNDAWKKFGRDQRDFHAISPYSQHPSQLRIGERFQEGEVSLVDCGSLASLLNFIFCLGPTFPIVD